MAKAYDTTNSPTRRGRGRPPSPLGVGIKCTVLIPSQLHAALLLDIEKADDLKNISEAIIARLLRGKKRSRTL